MSTIKDITAWRKLWDLLTSYLGQPYEYFLDQHSGELSTKVLSESQEAVLRFCIASEAFGGVKDIKLLGRKAAYVDRFNTPSHQIADSLMADNAAFQHIAKIGEIA